MPDGTQVTHDFKMSPCAPLHGVDLNSCQIHWARKDEFNDDEHFICYDPNGPPQIAVLGPCNATSHASKEQPSMGLIFFPGVGGGTEFANPPGTKNGIFFGGGGGCLLRDVTMTKINGLVTFAPWLNTYNGPDKWWCRPYRPTPDVVSAYEHDAMVTIEYARRVLTDGQPIVLLGHSSGARMVTGIDPTFLKQHGVVGRILSRDALTNKDETHSAKDVFDSDLPTLLLTNTTWTHPFEWPDQHEFLCCYKGSQKWWVNNTSKAANHNWFEGDNPENYRSTIQAFLECALSHNLADCQALSDYKPQKEQLDCSGITCEGAQPPGPGPSQGPGGPGGDASMTVVFLFVLAALALYAAHG